MVEEYKGGNLNALQTNREFPKIPGVERLPSRPKEITLKDFEIPYLDIDGSISEHQLNAILGLLVSRFYDAQGVPFEQPQQLLCWAVGMLAACINLKDRLPWPNMQDAMSTAGIYMQFRPKTIKDLKDEMDNDGRYKKFLEQWRRKHPEFIQSYLVFIYTCVVLTPMAKTLTDNNFEGWFTNRIKGFAGTLGDTFTPENSTLSTYPDITKLQQLQRFMGANHRVRKEFFKELIAICRRSRNFISKGLSEVLFLNRSLEMHHLFLVDKYIVQEHPEFMNMHFLRGLGDKFGRAVALLRSLDPSIVLYAKLLLDKNGTQSLNRANFEEAIVVATQIAQHTSSTFKNYFKSENTLLLMQPNLPRRREQYCHF